MATQFTAGQILTAAGLNAAVVDVGSVVNVTPTLSTTSSTYVSVTSALLNYTKNQASTRLLCVPIWTAWINGSFAASPNNFAQVEFAVQIDGTDNVAGFFNFNNTGVHQQMVGAVVVSGLSAGSKTLQLRARRSAIGSGSTGTVTCDTNDRASLLVFEIP